MNLTVLFDTIYEIHYTISANFYLYLQYFQQKVFNFNKINKFQKTLEPDICADIMVGDEMRRGISGGQKKRLTTGTYFGQA